LRHGHGIQIYADKSRYAGNWHFDVQNTYGTFKFADGSEYAGSLSNGIFEGYGEFTWPKSSHGDSFDNQVGHRYCGDWKQGKMHGKGNFHHA
jgi:hypothetical protein